jgi:hypothetical protein
MKIKTPELLVKDVTPGCYYAFRVRAVGGTTNTGD